jgi:hypothetical protein
MIKAGREVRYKGMVWRYGDDEKEARIYEATIAGKHCDFYRWRNASNGRKWCADVKESGIIFMRQQTLEAMVGVVAEVLEKGCPTQPPRPAQYAGPNWHEGGF